MSQKKRPEAKLPAGIVVGVDEGGASDPAVRMGLELGRRFSVRVDLIHAFHAPPDYWPGIDPLRGAEMTAELRDGIRKVINDHVRSVVGEGGRKVGAGGTGSRSRGAVAAPPSTDLVAIVLGHPARVLLEEARARKAGLIVLGGHHKREPLDLGNTMRAVFVKATVPVWVQPQPVGPVRSILAAVDLSEESLSALATACSVAKVFDGTVRAVQCFHASTAVLSAELDYPSHVFSYPIGEVRKSARLRFEKAMGEFDWQGVEHETEFVEGEPVQTLLDLSASSDLLVLGTHGRTGLASVVLGGVAYAILKRSRKPTLAVRHPDRTFLI